MTNKILKTPVALIILDGWGCREEKKDNGIAQANKPFFDSLWRDYPHTLIDGSGQAVGLPQGVMGNSEVGHMNLGAGRIVFTGLSQIYQAIENKSFFSNKSLLWAMQQAKEKGATLHLMGLLSDGAVHSHQDHLYALLTMAQKNQLTDVAVHCFMDGRDTPPMAGADYVEQLLQKMKEIGVGRIASIEGRYWSMDRDKRWDRVEKAFVSICGRSPITASDPVAYLKESYEKGKGDEFVEPVTILDAQGKATMMKKDDAAIFFNFRADRAREISHAFVDKDFKAFDRKGQDLPKVYVCLALYEVNLPAPVAFEPTYPQNTLPEVLAQHHKTQLRIAETEKYAHVTFFFNGGRELVVEGEDRKLIPSPKEVATYDLKPEMSAPLVKEEFLKCLDSQKYDVLICNFANTDMVGHTAVPAAIIKAVETVDGCLSEIVPRVLSLGGQVIVTADHGNAELMVENGKPMTAHTTNLVPFILVSAQHKNAKLRLGGRLCDVAPTLLALMGIEQPEEMTGISLVKREK